MRKLFLISIFLLIVISNANAFTSGSTGTDGELNVTANTQLQLPSDGVFNYTTVTIQSGKTLTFQKNANNTPVYILATDDVTIDGTINVSGGALGCVAAPGTGGPGGYSGGYGGPTGEPGGKGFGPGGGDGGDFTGTRGGGGGYGTSGGTWENAGGPSYGNVNIVPVIGGSGGGGSYGGSGHPGYGGSGGGGAIVIASSGTIRINSSGSIKADGGTVYCSDWGANGSGGAIKLMANDIAGSGTLSAKGGNPTWQSHGGQGRIRLEADYSNTFSGGSDPAYTFVDAPGSVLPANQPALAITSIGGQTVPASPTGSYSQPDITLPTGTTLVTVNVSAQNIPTTSIVTLTVIPQYGVTSEYDLSLSGTTESSTGTTIVTLSDEYPSVIVAETTFVMQVGMYYDNEKIEKVRVAAKMGKEAETIYITESGREIKSEVLKLAGLVK